MDTVAGLLGLDFQINVEMIRFKKHVQAWSVRVSQSSQFEPLMVSPLFLGLLQTSKGIVHVNPTVLLQNLYRILACLTSRDHILFFTCLLPIFFYSMHP